MITSKQIISLAESYKLSIKHHWTGVLYPVYENPTSSDYIELNKYIKSLNLPEYKKVYSVRFMVDFNSKKVYIADGYLSLHKEISQKLNLSWGKTLRGEATLKGGKAVIAWAEDYPNKLDDLYFHDSKKFFDSNEMKWLSQYFDLSKLRRYGCYGKQDEG